MTRWSSGWVAVLTSLVLGPACGAKVLSFDSSHDAAVSGQGGTSSGFGGAPMGVPRCGGVVCGGNQICCLLAATCVDPADVAQLCPKPAQDADPRTRCASNYDCAANEFCESDNFSLCLGAGHCVDRNNCGSSSGPPFCGCDGVTYPDKQTSCLYGTRVQGAPATCGHTHLEGGAGAPPDNTVSVTYCGGEDECPPGQSCCFISGRCYDTTHPKLCAFPPPDTGPPCESDNDCFFPDEYCKTWSCGSNGGCRGMPGSEACSEPPSPVCGCDGKTYANADCAALSAVNLASSGPCP